MLYFYLGDLSAKEWVMFSAGFSVGSVVEVSASMDHENGCLTQAASVSQAAFLAYYYYDMW